MTFQKVWDSLQKPDTTADNAEPEVAQIIRLMDSDDHILNSNDVPVMLAMVWAKKLKVKGVTERQLNEELDYRDHRGDVEGEPCEAGWDDDLCDFSLAEMNCILKYVEQ